MKRVIIVIVLLIGLVIGCSAIKIRDPMKAFNEASHGYRQAISWSEYVVAATYLKDEDEEKKEAQIERLNKFKVTAYEPRAVNVIEEDVRVRHIVKLSYFKRDDLVVKTIADDQIWQYDPELRTWLLVTGFPKFK